jgi:hypothetical protein
MNVDVHVRVRGSKVLERDGFAIGLQFVTGGEGLLRRGLREGWHADTGWELMTFLSSSGVGAHIQIFDCAIGYDRRVY